RERARVSAAVGAFGEAGRRHGDRDRLSGEQPAQLRDGSAVPPGHRAVRIAAGGARRRDSAVLGGRLGQRRPVADRLGKLPVDVATASAPLIDARELYRFFHAGDDETFALRGVSGAVQPGEMVAVVGRSGSGKSTLLACLAGLDEPDGGHVIVAGQRITRRPEATRAGLRARWIGMLLQSGNLLEHLSVRQNIEAAQAIISRGTRRAPRGLLDDVGLAERASARPSTLSGGEAARAGLAPAPAHPPPVLPPH